MDDMPTYTYVPLVYYYEGRVHEGLKVPVLLDFYRSYLNLRGKSTEDPLVAEIRPPPRAVVDTRLFPRSFSRLNPFLKTDAL